jgi:hypothetical protein
MVSGHNTAKCLHCFTTWTVGDAIPDICPTCVAGGHTGLLQADCAVCRGIFEAKHFGAAGGSTPPAPVPPRSILDILIDVQESRPTTLEEIRLALMAVHHMEQIQRRLLQELVEAIEQNKSLLIRMRVDSAKKLRESLFASRKKTPQEFLGEAYTPGTPEHTRFLAFGKALFKKATGMDL